MEGRRLALAVVASACGRIDFDPIADADPSEGAPTVAQSDLIAWYGMAALPGGVVTDLTGLGHDASCTTCPPLVPGRYGNAVAFNGTQYLGVVSTNDLHTTTGFTIALWVWLDTAQMGFRGHVVTKTFGPDIRNSWVITIESDQVAHVYADGPTTPRGVGGSTVLSYGQWHHVAFRWDGSNGDLLVDAKLDGSGALPDIGWDDGPVNLGTDFEVGAPCPCGFAGRLDDVRIYRRPLTDGEIAVLAAP